MLIRNPILLLLLFLATGAQAAGCDDKSTVVKYLKTIEDMNWRKMKHMLADDAVYRDPTMVYFKRPEIGLNGKDDITGFWEDASKESGASRIGYNLKHCFETAGFHVVLYDTLVEVRGHLWNINQENVTMPGQVMSVIRIEQGLIKEHIDYVDYAATIAFLDQLRKEAGVAPE